MILFRLNKLQKFVVTLAAFIILAQIILLIVQKDSGDGMVNTYGRVNTIPTADRELTRSEVVKNPSPNGEMSRASWYDYSLPGAPVYSKTHATAASRDYPRGTYLKVTRDQNSVIVRVNDYVENPKVAIDLSSYAFKQLAPLSRGVIMVRIIEEL